MGKSPILHLLDQKKLQHQANEHSSFKIEKNRKENRWRYHSLQCIFAQPDKDENTNNGERETRKEKGGR